MKYILENLAIGNFQDAVMPPEGIDALLCVAEEKDITGTPLLYHKVPITDMKPVPAEKLKESVDWIKEHIKEHKIMVFCNAGVGRSPTVVISYLCCELDYSFGNAVEFVATKKPDISILPNLILAINEIRKK